MTNSDNDQSKQGKNAELAIGTREAFRRLFPFLVDHKRALISCFGLLAATTGLSLSWPLLLQKAIDSPIENKVLSELLYYALAIALIQIATVGFQYALRVWLEIVGQDIMLKLKKQLFEHTLSLELSFFDSNPVGRLMARIESDTESLRLLFTNTVLLVVADLLLLIGIYAVLFFYNWRMASLLLISVPVLALLTWGFHRLTTHRFLEVRKKMAEVTATLTEYLHGMSITQIFHRSAYVRERVYAVNKEKFEPDAFVNISVTLFFNVVFFFEYVKIGLVLMLGAKWGLSAGETVMFLVLIWRSFEPIFRTSEQLSNFQKGVAGAKRIFALLHTTSELSDPDNPVTLPEIKESIRFENVWFSYTGDDNYALKNVSFEVKVGQRVAIVGVTGGGKSTVISLLLRFYDPQKGRITIDGVDIRHLRKDDLRKKFALVLQDIFLFPGDVAHNIGLGSSGISDELIATSAITVSADRFIEKLPDGMATKVSEKGTNFSRGERQLLSFARALAFNPQVLILDEATSSVDPDTERHIQKSLSTLMKGRTSVIVAHRLSTILDANLIIVIRDGEIIERGTHVELLLADDYYSRLFHLQFKRKGVTQNV